MSKGKWLIAAALLICFKAAGETVYIAPLLSVEEGTESYEIDERYRDDIYNSMNDRKELLDIKIVKTGKKIKTVRSSYDALKICKEEKIGYLLYGWIKKGEYTYEGEIRIFDGEGRKNIGTVYEKDGIKEYEKFITGISMKVLDRLQELFYVPKAEGEEKHSSITAQTDIGYWTFMNGNWTKYIAGTISIGGGLEVIPDDRVFFIKKKRGYFSVGISMDYRMGISMTGAVKSVLNTLNVCGYTNVYINFYDVHSIYGKAGILYGLEMLSYKDKYADRKTAVSGSAGIVTGLGYAYGVTEKIKLLFESDFELFMYKKLMSKYRGKFGVEFELYKKEYKKQ